MGAPQTITVQAVPIPVRGMNVRDPLASMDPSYAPWLLNFEPEPQYLKIRTGQAIHATITGTTPIVLGLGMFNNANLYAYCQYGGGGTNKIIDVTTSTISDVTPAGLVSGAADEAFVCKFNKRTAFATETTWATNAAVWNGSAWSMWGFTESGSAIGGRCVTSYKGRVYIAAGTNLYYSTLAAVTGAMTLIDMSSLFEEAEGLCWIARLTSPTNATDDTLLAFGNEAGEVLVYTGDNPGSPNWAQVARFKIARPLFYNSILEFRNDIWIATETGVVSVRKLFQVGSDDPDNASVSATINPYWTSLVRAIKTGSGTIFGSAASMAWWPEQNKVYVLVKGNVDKDGAYASDSGTMFVHNLISGAWVTQMLPGVGQGYRPSLTYCNNNLYYAINSKVMKYSTAVYKDQQWDTPAAYSAYDLELQSAYNNFGDANKNKQIVGFEPILKTDFNGIYVGLQAAADFGRKVSSTKTVTLLDGYQQPFYSVGVQGDYLQYRIDGESDINSTDGLELYSMGVAVK